MTEALNALRDWGPLILSVVAVMVAIQAFAVARLVHGRQNELEALVSRYRRPQPTAADRLPPPEVG
jgi:hypothetical protein